MRYFLILYFSFLIAHSCQAQYPQGYFRNPLGIPMQLVANFGEVRTDHFHMGFDLRTNQRENLPVYAAAEGYISRVVIEPGGYGRGIYVTHPNGYTTLYAHLNDFYPALQQWVKDKQYREEKWEQDIRFEPDQFPVLSGQFMAYSGNTGASQGPHLHFEIRETKTGININPLLFGFPVKDNISPLIYKLYIYDRNYSTYSVNPSEIRLKGEKSIYTTRDSLLISTSGKISFGISSEDIGNTSSFRYGIYAAELWMDSIKQTGFTLNKLSYADSRFVNASIDYKKRITTGSLIQHLSRLPGNHLSNYEGLNDGVIQLTDTLPHEYMIIIKDASGNTSVLKFMLAWKPELYEQRYFTQDTEKLIPNVANKFVRDNISIDFPPATFYDTVYFSHAEINTAVNDLPIHQLHHHYVPLHNNYTVAMDADESANHSKVVWKLNTVKGSDAGKVQLHNGSFTSVQDRFGMLHLLLDTIPPVIATFSWRSNSSFAKSEQLMMSVKDGLSAIATFRAELDGKWIMFSQRGNIFTYKFDEHCDLGTHALKILAEDIAGNRSIKTFNFELKEKIIVPKKKKYVKKKSKKKKR